jgi:hypothetical protein
MRRFVDPVGERLYVRPRHWEADAVQAPSGTPRFEIWHGGKRTSSLEQVV